MICMIVSHNIASFEINNMFFYILREPPQQQTWAHFYQAVLGWICICVQGSSLDVRQKFLRTTSGLEPRKFRFLARGSVWLTKHCQRCHAIAKFLSNARIPSAIFDLMGGFSCEKSREVLGFKGGITKWLRDTCHELNELRRPHDPCRVTYMETINIVSKIWYTPWKFNIAPENRPPH